MSEFSWRVIASVSVLSAFMGKLTDFRTSGNGACSWVCCDKTVIMLAGTMCLPEITFISVISGSHIMVTDIVMVLSDVPGYRKQIRKMAV